MSEAPTPEARICKCGHLAHEHAMPSGQCVHVFPSRNQCGCDGYVFSEELSLRALLASKDRDLAAVRQEHEQERKARDAAEAHTREVYLELNGARQDSSRRAESDDELRKKLASKDRDLAARQEREYWGKLSALLRNGGMDDPAFICGQVEALLQLADEWQARAEKAESELSALLVVLLSDLLRVDRQQDM